MHAPPPEGAVFAVKPSKKEKIAMTTYSLSWCIGVGDDADGGKKRTPAWSDIEQKLSDAWKRSGTVTLDVSDGPDIGPQSLQMQTENAQAVIMLGVDDGAEYEVRTYSEGLHAHDAEILGNRWSGKTVCSDLNIVSRAFREFSDTGDVSGDLLD